MAANDNERTSPPFAAVAPGMDLPATLVAQVLRHLGIAPGRPDIRQLNRLLHQYSRRVPWESASRRVRRATRQTPEASAQWPVAFWNTAMATGLGGTCFESNYAFMALLRALGYHGYLTINNMGATLGCHTALVIALEGGTYLADVGYPIPRALPVRPAQLVRSTGPYHTYLVWPDPEHGVARYQIERTRHPNRNVFTLIDQPVSDEIYRQALVNDYGPGGLFLDRVVINKYMAVAGRGERLCRFNSRSRPWQIEVFAPQGAEMPHPLPEEAEPAAAVLGQWFGMDEGVLASALADETPVVIAGEMTSKL